MSKVNFMQIVPNSHSWENLDMLRNDLTSGAIRFKTIEELVVYLKIGIDNTQKRGYELRKKKK